MVSNLDPVSEPLHSNTGSIAAVTAIAVADSIDSTDSTAHYSNTCLPVFAGKEPVERTP